MQSPISLRPWPLPRDLDLQILAYLDPADGAAFSRASRGCLEIIKRLDEALFATSSLKPERFKQVSWLKIALNQYKYPKSTTAEKRSINPSIKKVSQLKRDGQMMLITYEEEQRLIDYQARLFRILPLDEKVVHTSFLSALIFRKGRYEIFDRNCQTPIRMPEGVQVDSTNPAIMCFEGEKAAIIVSREGKKHLALAGRNGVSIRENALEGKITLYALNEILAVVNGLSFTLLGIDGTIKKTLTFEREITKCKMSAREFWVATSNEIFVYDFKTLSQKKFFPILNPNVFYACGFLVEFRASRFIISGEKIVLSELFNEGARLNYYKEIDGLLYLKINLVAFVYDLKQNKITQVDSGSLIGSDHFWLEKHLVLITGFGDTYKMVG